MVGVTTTRSASTWASSSPSRPPDLRVRVRRFGGPVTETSIGSTTTHTSFCRMCHSACPILVEVEDGRVVKVTGDPASEIYHGYSCIKGRALPEMHNSPERLLHSLKRGPDGVLAPIPVEQAMDEIAAKLQQVLAEHGPLA